MIANREQCLDQPSLNDLLAGRYPPERFAIALEHVESCPRCAQAAEEATSGGQVSWLGKAIKQSRQDSFDREIECQAVVNQLLLYPQTTANDTQVSRSLPIETLGPYRLLRWLGAGAMGAVYLAEHQRLKRLAAIKLLPRDKLMQSGWLDRFNREMTSIAALENPHVVRAIDAGDEAGWHFLVMEYLDGLDVSKVCRRVNDIPIDAACEIVRQAALGLAAIHSLGMTHRDVKPSNLFLTRSGMVKLLDLGLVLSGDSLLAADERLTTVGHLMGTVPYMAREQLLDASGVDWRADLYSLGATLCRLLTGRAPYGPATNLAQTIQAIGATECPPIKSLRSDVPDQVAELVDRMLSHDIEQRPQSAQEIANLLAPFCSAKASQSLVLTAMNCSVVDDETLNSQLNPTPLPICKSGRSRSRWPVWVAAAFLPLAFLAGILVTVVTDKGTLIVESNQPGVTVKVLQGDKVIENLRVEQQPTKLRLYSGKYIIELDGVDADSFEISDRQVTLNRGDKQVVKIYKRSIDVDSSLPSEDVKAKSYQGKSFAYWMNILEHERDVATISQAMQAVVLLVETSDERLMAARKCLIPARELGGLVMSGKSNQQFGNVSLSGWFMSELNTIYPSFFPQPGLAAIIDELEQGSDRSAQACIQLLLEFHAGTTRFEGTEYRVTPSDYFKELAKSESGVKDLKRLNVQLQKVADTFNSRAADERDILGTTTSMAIARRIEILQALRSDLSDAPQIVDWAKMLLTSAQEVIDLELKPDFNGGMGGGMGSTVTIPDRIKRSGVRIAQSPLDFRTALVVDEILQGEYRSITPVVLGLLQPTFGPSNEIEARVMSTLEKLAKNDPSQTSLAILKHFQRTLVTTSFFGNQKPAETSKRDDSDQQDFAWSTERVRIASEVFLDNPTPTTESIKALVHALQANDSLSIFLKADIEHLLGEMLMRLMREATAEQNASIERAEFAIVTFAFSNIPIPKEHTKELLTLLLRRLNSELNLYSSHDEFNYNNPWPAEFAMNFTTRDGTNGANWNDDNFIVGLNKLVARNPAVAVDVLTSEIAQSTLTKPSNYLSPFASLQLAMQHLTLADNSDEATGEKQARTTDPSIDFLQTEAGKEAMRSLGQALDLEIGRHLKRTVLEDLSAIYALVSTRHIIADFLSEESSNNAEFRQGLTRIVTHSGEEFRFVPLRLLIMFAELEEGYKDIPFTKLRMTFHEMTSFPDCAAIQRLIRGVYESRPDEFRAYFLSYLQEEWDSTTVRELFSPETRCEAWYREIVNPLYEDAETRGKTVEAINLLIAKSPPEFRTKLKSLLPDK